MIPFRDLLRSKLTDPANRQNEEWIFDNFPREEFGMEPVITIIGIGESSRPYGLHNSEWLGKQMLQVDVWCRDDVGYIINDQMLYDKDLLISLTDLIEKTLRTNWISLPISLFEMTNRTPIFFNKDKLLWNISLTYEIQAIE